MATAILMNQFRRRRPLRQEGRHPRGVSLAGLRADLLALPMEEVGNRVAATPTALFRPGRTHYNDRHALIQKPSWPSWSALDSARTKSSHPSVRAGWARCIAPMTRSLVATSR